MRNKESLIATLARLVPVVFALVLAGAGALIAFGVAAFHPGAGLIAGGVLLAAWAWLVMADVAATPDDGMLVEDDALSVEG